MDTFGTERRTQWGRLFLLVGVGIASAFQIGKAPPVLSILRTELGLTLFLAGWVLSAFNIMGALIAPVAGAIADWLGHRRLIIFGLGCMAVAVAYSGDWQIASWVLAVVGLIGVGLAFGLRSLELRMDKQKRNK